METGIQKCRCNLGIRGLCFLVEGRNEACLAVKVGCIITAPLSLEKALNLLSAIKTYGKFIMCVYTLVTFMPGYGYTK